MDFADSHPARADDQRAIARYRYLLDTAPPEALEQAHAQAFATLTAEQRQLVLQQLAQVLPASDRALAGPGNANPAGLARLVTRAEMQRPGTLERLFGAAGDLRLGGLVAGSLLGSIAGTVIGSALVREFLADGGMDPLAAQGTAPAVPADSLAASGALEDDPGDGFDFGGFDIV